MVSIIPDLRFGKLTTSFIAAGDFLLIPAIYFLIKAAQAEGIKTAKTYLETFVYNTSLPEHSVRTRRTWDAIKPTEITRTILDTKGIIHVDRMEFPGFYYPYILDRGRSDINYQPRPFFRFTIRDMKVKFPIMGAEMVPFFVNKLLR